MLLSDAFSRLRFGLCFLLGRLASTPSFSKISRHESCTMGLKAPRMCRGDVGQPRLRGVSICTKTCTYGSELSLIVSNATHHGCDGMAFGAGAANFMLCHHKRQLHPRGLGSDAVRLNDRASLRQCGRTHLHVLANQHGRWIFCCNTCPGHAVGIVVEGARSAARSCRT